MVKKLFLNTIFIPFLFCFSYLIPKKRKLILLGSAFGREFIGNTKYFYLHLLSKNEADLLFYWITGDKIIYFDFKKKGWPVLYRYSLSGIWHILRANYLLVEQATQDITGMNILLGKFRIFNLWHGDPIKKFFFGDKYIKGLKYLFIRRYEWPIYKFILSASDTSAEKLKNAFKNKNIINAGYPRDDIFFNENRQYVNYKKILNLGKYKKIFLYLPTYRDGVESSKPFSDNFLNKLNEFLVAQKAVLLVKKHRDENNIEIRNDLSNIIDISGKIEDIQDLLIDVDVLISDYSSVVFEFVLTNRPVVLYPYDLRHYLENCRELYYDYYSDMAGPFAENETDLLILLRDLPRWFGDAKYFEKYQAFKKRFNNHLDGKSSDRLYNFLIDKINL